MLFLLNEVELRKALKELENASENGFDHSLATFKVNSLTEGKHLVLEYDDIWDKGHETDPKLDWGRQDVSKNFRLVDGKLAPIESGKQ
jgi:hypothetical protein